MPIGTSDYKIVSTASDPGGTKYRNVYYYSRVGGVGDAQVLAQAFDNDVVPDIAAILHTSMTIDTTEVINLEDTEDFWTTTPSEAGDYAGTAAPNFIAVGFRIFRSDRAFRNGAKRYGKIPLDVISSNAWITGYNTLLATLASSLLGQISFSTSTYELRIPKSVINEQTGKYELTDLNAPANVLQDPIPTTQNTRKANRGE